MYRNGPLRNASSTSVPPLLPSKSTAPPSEHDDDGQQAGDRRRASRTAVGGTEISSSEDDPPKAQDSSLASASIDDSSGSALHDDSEVLQMIQQGALMFKRYQSSGVLAELGEGINALKNASSYLPQYHPMKALCLDGLGTLFRCRFDRLGDRADAHEAITAQQEAVLITPDPHPQKPVYLNNLGLSFLSRFEHLDDLVDAGEAITAQQQAVRLTLDGDPYKPGRLNNLGNSFLRRFERLGALADIDEAITAQRHAVRLTPDGDPNKPGRLNNLGLSLLRQYERLGNLVDVDGAITALQQAVRPIPDGDPAKPGSLGNLGLSFTRRFERLGEVADVDEAIAAQKQAVRLTPDGHPEKPAHLSNLGLSLIQRFKSLSEPANLDEAIMAQQQAVGLTPNGHPNKPGCLNNLGTYLRHRFELLGNLADVDEAITAQQQAVLSTPDGHLDKAMYINNLGTTFGSRFQSLGNLADLDLAITALQQAIHLTPDDDPRKPGHLNNLGASFQLQLRHRPDDVALARAISTYSQSAQSVSGPSSLRFDAACEWASLCFSTRSHATLDAYSTLVDLLPRLIWLGKTVDQRYKDVSGIGNVMADAVVAAVHFGKLSLALEWMEQGRSIVWGQILQLRTPLDELRQLHPDEANKLEKISHALDAGGVAYPGHSEMPSEGTYQSLEQGGQAHRRLAEDYDRTLARIRNLPDFAGFLQPAKSTSLCGAAISGPVVIMNAHDTRCDALVLLPRSSQVYHVPLPGLQLSAVQEMHLQLAGLTRGADTIQRHYALYSDVGALSDILGRLWSHMIEPILNYLKLLRKPTGNELPHITWHLTGPFTFLPIHAAGLYDTKDQPKIFDYVVSSYTPTLAALLSAKNRPPRSSTTPRLLTISQPATPHQNRLPGALREVDTIQSLQRQTDQLHVTRLDDREATVAAVLQHMEGCNWIHLACHGVQDAANPTDSAFLLIDNPLTLREIMKKSFSHTELAVLSACQTAKGDSGLPNEAIHLAAGMLAAGYASVVATMWSIQDDDAPIIAEKFYKYLIEEAGGDSGGAAYALHYAVAHLREVRGENNFASWAPFIHLGICSYPRPLPK